MPSDLTAHSALSAATNAAGVCELALGRAVLLAEVLADQARIELGIVAVDVFAETQGLRQGVIVEAALDDFGAVGVELDEQPQQPEAGQGDELGAGT